MIYTTRDNNLVIKRPDCDRDFAAIALNYKRFKDDFLVDSWRTDDDVFLKHFIANETSRVIKLGDDYIAFAMLEGFANNLTAFLHGYPNRIGKDFKITGKHLIQGARERAIEQLCLHYFETYGNHTSKRLECIEIELPEFVHNYRTEKGEIKLTAWSKAILDAGFTLITNKPRRNAERKDNKPIATFLFQLQGSWLQNWIKIENGYLAGETIEVLSAKYRKKPEQIKQRLINKRIIQEK